MSNGEWRCSWSSADRRCSNYIWAINNLIAYWSAAYIRDLAGDGQTRVQYTAHLKHYNDVIMSAMASQTTSLAIVFPSVYSGADQRKHQSSASLAFARGIHRSPVNSPHKWPVTRKMFPFDDVIMMSTRFALCCGCVPVDFTHNDYFTGTWKNLQYQGSNLEWCGSIDHTNPPPKQNKTTPPPKKKKKNN